jgi:cytochrome P450
MTNVGSYQPLRLADIATCRPGRRRRMTASDGGTGTDLPPGRAVVLFRTDGLPGWRGANTGWRMHVADVPANDPAACVDSVADFMAAPSSPDRAVLVGQGPAALAVLDFADRHPERTIAVVVADPSDAGAETGGLRYELSCPVLDVSAKDPDAVVSAVTSFLAGLDPQAGCPVPRPARLPALTPTLLNDSEVIGRLREMGPVHRINAPGVATSWLLTGYGATTRALADPGLSGGAEMTAGFRLQPADAVVEHRGERDLVTIDGQEHARLRGLVGRYLTPGRVMGTLRDRVQRETDALLSALPTGAVVDLLQSFARPLPVIVLCELFGIPARDRGYIQEWLLDRMTVTPPVAHSDVDDYLRVLIAERRERPTDDLFGWVVAVEGAQVSEVDLVSAARLLMVAGHRAPTTLLANGLAALLREREHWMRLTADPTLVDAAVEELLRFVTPFPVGLARYVNSPIDLDGAVVPQGDLVAASLVAANHDPSMFARPEAFELDRDRNLHLAFGYGHHYCLGSALARMQAQVAIGTLARRFPDLALAHGPERLQYRQSRVRYLLDLPVVLRPDHIASPP